MQDISGFGIEVSLVASVTFPNGIQLSAFADDADPFDVPSQQITETAMGLNGDLVNWSSANPIPLTLNMIADSDDDTNLDILAEANRVGLGKSSARDVITLNVLYPNGDTITFSNGKMTDAMMANSVASAGRLKSKAYVFAFENRVRT